MAHKISLLNNMKNTGMDFFFEKHSINTDTHSHMNTHPYEHTYTHSTCMNISERLSQLDPTKSVSLSTEMSPPTKKIIIRKYNTYVKFRI
jgi:hypothetical protein